MANPKAAMLVIGDEILSGRTRDANMFHLAGKLVEVGIDLTEVRIVPDDQSAIVAALRALSTAYDHVFTSGGIGPTHDDITADCVAKTMGATIDVREDALGILQAFYDRQGIEMNAARLRMARVPDGAAIIENPISAAPGFTLGNVHVMAGVPAIFEAMVAGLLPTLTGGEPLQSKSVRIEQAEGDIAAVLNALVADYPGLSFGSYPFRDGGMFGTNIVIRGVSLAMIDDAVDRLVSEAGALQS